MIDISSIEPAYIATPYTKFHKGHAAAYLDACKIAAAIQRRYKVSVFCPIAQCHGMTVHGDLPAVDRQFWRRFNAPFVKLCGGLIVAMMDGWRESDGIADEIADFGAGKPIYYCDVETLELKQEPF